MGVSLPFCSIRNIHFFNPHLSPAATTWVHMSCTRAPVLRALTTHRTVYLAIFTFSTIKSLLSQALSAPEHSSSPFHGRFDSASPGSTLQLEPSKSEVDSKSLIDSRTPKKTNSLERNPAPKGHARIQDCVTLYNGQNPRSILPSSPLAIHNVMSTVSVKNMNMITGEVYIHVYAAFVLSE
jgi:hypothetical protein